MSKIELPPLPEPDLYAHELIANGGGVWLACNSLEIVRQAHDPGETGEEIKHLFTADQLRARYRQIVELCAQECEWLATVMSGPNEGDGEYAIYMRAAAAIRALLDEKKENE